MERERRGLINKKNKVFSFILVILSVFLINSIFTESYAASSSSGKGGYARKDPGKVAIFKYLPKGTSKNFGRHPIKNFTQGYRNSATDYFDPIAGVSSANSDQATFDLDEIGRRCDNSDHTFILAYDYPSSSGTYQGESIYTYKDPLNGGYDYNDVFKNIKEKDPVFYEALMKSGMFNNTNDPAYNNYKNNIRILCREMFVFEPDCPEGEVCEPPKQDPPEKDKTFTIGNPDQPINPGNPGSPGNPGKPGTPRKPGKPRKTIDKIKLRGGGNVDPPIPSSGSGPCQRADYESPWIKQKIYGGKYPENSQHLAMTEYRHVIKPVKSEGLMEIFEEKEEAGYIKSAQEQMSEWEATHKEEKLPKGWPAKTEYFIQLEKFDSENLGSQIKNAGTIEASKEKANKAAEAS